jgi:hypothetical protein
MTQATPPGWYPNPDGSPGQRYFDGSEWTDHRAAPQAPIYIQQTPRRRVWPWVLLTIFVVMLIGFGGCVAFVGSVANEVAKDPRTTVEPPSGGGSTSAADTGPAFPGKQPNDTGVLAGGSVTSDGVTTTSTPLSSKDQFGNTYLCTLLTLQNSSTEQVSFNTLFDWKMQDPTGTTRSASVSGAENFLSAGEVAPGGTATGDVCFESPQGNPRGTYVVLFDPTFRFSSNRVGWINQI